MDPLSIVASIAAVISATGVVISYMGDVKDAPKEKLTLADEAKILLDLFLRLRNRAEDAEKTKIPCGAVPFRSWEIRIDH